MDSFSRSSVDSAEEMDWIQAISLTPSMSCCE
jgi:hypothetical protein